MTEERPVAVQPAPFPPDAAGESDRDEAGAAGWLSPLLTEGGALIRDFIGFGGRRLTAAVGLMIVGGILEGVGLALLVPIFSLLAPEAGGRWRAVIVAFLSRLGIGTPTGQLAAALLAFCVLVAVRAVVLSARDRLVSDLTLGFGDYRRLILVRDLAHARWAALAGLRHARIGHLLSSEIGQVAFAASLLMHVAAAAVMLGTQMLLVIALSPALALMTIGLAAAGLIVLVPLSRRAARVGKSTSRFAFRIAGEAAHFLGGLKVAVAHDMADVFVAQIARESALLRVEQDARQRLQSRFSVASTTIASLVGAVMVLGAVTWGVSTVSLLAALVVLARMSGPVRSLQLSAQQLFGALPAFTALRELRADLGEAVPAAGDVGPPLARGAIRFEQVFFRYPGAATPVFAGLDLVIEPGEMVGLAGPSGTGKTSFVDLLTGLLEPGEGRIAVGDAVLDRTMLAAWRRRLAYVAQDSYLINDSIRRNLNWGGERRPDDDLWDALAQAEAAEVVAAMPGRLDTRADERGTRLSGGERQRIALARALLRDPELLILDEATNAIDIATEARVLANVRRALPNATILIVAHRDETLRVCDRVVTLASAQTKRATSASAGSTG